MLGSSALNRFEILWGIGSRLPNGRVKAENGFRIRAARLRSIENAEIIR